MNPWRAYRFPPLLAAQLGALAAAEPGSAQASAADGFRQGMDLGYGEGYASGESAGKQAGFDAGLAAGREQGRREAMQQVLAQFDGAARPLDVAAAAMERCRVDYQSALREDVINLVAKVARQVIRCELTLKPAQILDLVEETLAALPPRAGEVEILLNSEEYQRIRELAPERASRWALRPDSTLAQGECRIRSADSDIDAGCEQRLGACVERLREQLSADSALPLPAGDD
ncbi:flagellar assembly protein FliH [Vogesella indigofera]|uniref:flagellar assembly protein FliH n=1 Tax=Vogesella indigofera TaxID=45465 RepID=UPI00234E88CA|nr:flagellar assembly protein FliH [Vogesella indigofera]MDC7706137.1 flagellar assembly protein FliH [Vogesella indigofera]